MDTEEHYGEGAFGLEESIIPGDNRNICFTCRSFLERSHEPFKHKGSDAFIWKDIVPAAVAGCRLCRFFLNVLTRKGNNANESGMKTKAELFYKEPIIRHDGLPSLNIRFLIITGECDGSHRQIMIKFLPNISDGNEGKVRDKSILGISHDLQVAGFRDDMVRNSGHERCLQQALKWMRTCVENHPRCSAIADTDDLRVYPARLLDVSGATLQLVSSKDLAGKLHLKYITLSHIWTRDSMPKLLKCNLKERLSNMATVSLPKVFQDAIVLTRTFSLRYLWIDALCILQDDDEDLQREISIMHDIYRNATLNIGGLQASTGLFLDRDARTSSPFAVTFQRGRLRQKLFVCPELVLNKDPLMKRGWVLQERLLSRRSLYFGEQVYWECGETLASECYPDHVPSFARSTLGETIPYKISTIFSHNYNEQRAQLDQRFGVAAEYEDIVQQSWMSIVVDFSRSQLTFEQDYLPALSGLAHVFQSTVQDNYYAGLWGRYLPTGLLWHAVLSVSDRRSVYPAQYRAPSWSWASLNAPIRFLRPRKNNEDGLLSIHEIETKAQGIDPLGRVSSGYLRLSGCVKRKVSRTHEKSLEGKLATKVNHHDEWYDSGYHDDDDRPLLDTYLLLVGYQQDYRDANAIRKYLGIILEAIDAKTSTYKRIGAFERFKNASDHHLNREGQDPADYSEFFDFDPNNFKRQTITII